MEFGFVTAALVGVSLWARFVRTARSVVLGPRPTAGSVVLDGLVAGVVLLAGFVAFVGAYAASRNVDVGLTLPSASDLPVVGLAASTPVALVAVTELVGVAADAYDRTDSHVAPALAYASVLLANRAVVVVFETGLRRW